jgi:hypothetical protein
MNSASSSTLPSYQWEGRGLAIILFTPQHNTLAQSFKDSLEKLRFNVQMKELVADFSVAEKFIRECK